MTKSPPPFVLGVDLDGVCGDHTAAFRAVVATERGVDPCTLGPQTAWNFRSWGVSDEAFLSLHRKAVLEHHMFRTMPVIEGTAETLWRLSDAGVWIRLITHRLYANWGHAIAVADTVAWLDDAGIPYRDLCFLGDKPDVGADLYIDDAPHNLEALMAAGHEVVVFDQPYNRQVAAPRACSWRDVEQLVADRLVAHGHAIQGRLLDEEHPDVRLAAALRHAEIRFEPHDPERRATMDPTPDQPDLNP
jgi:5'(3')-deoxyribonucleotidase